MIAPRVDVIIIEVDENVETLSMTTLATFFVSKFKQDTQDNQNQKINILDLLIDLSLLEVERIVRYNSLNK